jgi:MoaA/NifB/PqqE/SkfB family radical SAM enzyme
MSYQSDVTKVDRVQDAGEFPAVVLIDNCSACNLRCSMCDHQHIRDYRKIDVMKIDLYRKIIDEISRENPTARVWQIYFGDPFLCRDMPERIQYAKAQGLTDVVLNSNGVLMGKEKAQAYIEAGLDAMYVGVDAATAETYDKIRIGGDFKRAVQNVLGYRDLLKSHGRPAQQLFVQFVMSDVNEHEAEAFRAFWKEEGVGVKIRPKISWAGLIEAANLRDNATIDRKPCYWLMRTMNICCDGEVSLCSVDLHCRVKCGNVRERSLKEIWMGSLRDYRRMHQESRFGELPALCRDCMDWQSTYAEFS